MRVHKGACTASCIGNVVSRIKGNNSRSYVVTVEYEIGGNKYQIIEVARRKYKKIAIGGVVIRSIKVFSNPDMVRKMSVVVMYNPLNPREAYIEGNVGLG